jgi:iron complex transport system substrate-binding protein
MGSSTGNYSLFNAVHAKNVLDIAGYTGYQKALDMETILSLNPEVIILDAGGLSILKEEYAANRAVFDSLTAFQTGEVYLQMPYNAYYTNLEIAFADAYFIGKALYPDAFADVDMADTFGEISTFLLGTDCYADVAEAMYGGYQKLDVSLLQ